MVLLLDDEKTSKMNIKINLSLLKVGTLTNKIKAIGEEGRCHRTGKD